MGAPEPLVVLATVDAVLVLLFFALRALPRSRPGPWRRIWILIGFSSLFFVIAELATLTLAGTALALAVQVPLFGSILALTAVAFTAYLDAYRAAQRAVTLALTDPLTGIPNLRAFEERLNVALEGEEPFAIAYVDLDGFRAVNDTFGHAKGNEVLRTVASALAEAVRKSDVAARLGGDEFTLFLAGSDESSARMIAERAAALIRARLRPLGDLPVGTSIGIVTRGAGVGATELIAAADRAMYAAKREGGGISFAAP